MTDQISQEPVRFNIIKIPRNQKYKHSSFTNYANQKKVNLHLFYHLIQDKGKTAQIISKYVIPASNGQHQPKWFEAQLPKYIKEKTMLKAQQNGIYRPVQPKRTELARFQLIGMDGWWCNFFLFSFKKIFILIYPFCCVVIM